MAGLFFCLASDTVQGFYFALLQYNPIQAFTVRFVLFVQLYRTRYQTDTSGYNTACATPDAVQLSTAAYYNKVYKGAAVRLCYRSMPDGTAYRRPCQPGGVSMLPTPGGL